MQIKAGSHVHFVGDSITAISWYDGQYGGGLYQAAPNSFLDRIQTAGQALPAVVRAGVNTGMVAIVGGMPATVSPAPQNLMTTSQSGVSGNVAADILSDGVNVRVTNFNPDVVVLEIGVNDAGEGTDYSVFQAEHASIIAQILAWKPTTQILCMGIACYFEQWQLVNGVPSWGIDIHDAAIIGINNAIQANVAANIANCTYVNLRDPCLATEVAFNSPPPGLLDQIVCNGAPHPSTYLGPTAAGSGMVLWGGWAYPYVKVVAP